MLYDIVMGVLALSFLLAIVLESVVIFIVLQEKPEKSVAKVNKPRKFHISKKEKKKITEEMKRFETLLDNIDAYDGTDYGQKDIE